MDIVIGRISVQDLEGLSGHNAEHVRVITAAFLVEHHLIRGKGKCALRKAFLDVNKYIGQFTPAHYHSISRLRRRGTAGILRHIERFQLWRRAFEAHYTRSE